MSSARGKALALPGVTEFGDSKRTGSRYYVKHRGKIINFGSKNGETFLDHGDENKKKAWYARHSKILDKQGKKVINDPTSPSYYASRVLW